MPVRTESMLSLLERRTLRGVKAYAKIPTRSENPAMPVLVLNRLVPLTGVMYVLYTIATSLVDISIVNYSKWTKKLPTRRSIDTPK